MKIVVFSDVHGNLPALSQMIRDEKDCDKFIFLGDAVNYGPWSNECVEVIDTLQSIECIRGNHEEYFLDGRYGGINPIAKAFFNFCYPSFDKHSIIKNYLEQWNFSEYTFVHTIMNKNIYPDTEVILNRNYFIGHSHHQFEIRNNGYILFNAGSVGQNRQYINVINYARWYPEKDQVDLVGIKYNVDLLINEMRVRQYPDECINYYMSKRRIQ